MSDDPRSVGPTVKSEFLSVEDVEFNQSHSSTRAPGRDASQERSGGSCETDALGDRRREPVSRHPPIQLAFT